MCAPTSSIASTNTNTTTSRSNSLRRLRTRSSMPVIESDTTTITPENITISTAPSRSERTNIGSEKRRERRRRARRVGNVRPDSSGRIGNKECHIFAFTEQLEERVAMAELM